LENKMNNILSPELNTSYHTPYGSVVFNHSVKHSVIRLSGGFDSGVILYLLAKALSEHRSDAVITPITVQRRNVTNERWLERVHIVPYVTRIIQYVRDQFPTVTIHDSIVEDANYWWIQDNKNQSTYTESQSAAIRYVVWNHKRSIKDHWELAETRLIEYNGVTRNPPTGCIEDSEERHRDHLHPDAVPGMATVISNHKLSWYYGYQPWRNADKRIVFWVADEVGVLSDMLSITRSCEGDIDNTDNFTKECGTCWWCLERNWSHKNFKNMEIIHEPE
tara:strand:+ start:1290 stop:2120 length:831 start_codon:yes stop_codon:yes gene_type:complete